MFLSVIIPCYNVAPYIGRAIESLLRQTGVDCEIIIVDDGSTDNLLEVCKRWKEIEYIKIVHTDNQGVSEARNAGLQMAQGEYVFFMDPDDWIDDGTLGKLVEKCEETKADAIQFGYKTVDAFGNKVFDCGLEQRDERLALSDDGSVIIFEGESVKKELLPRYIGFSLDDLVRFGKSNFREGKEPSVVWSFVIRREILIKNNIRYPKGLHFMEDKLFLCEILCYANKIVKYNRIIYNYFIRDNGLRNTNLTNNAVHIQQRLLGEQYREALTTRMKAVGIELEKYYQGTLILASIELLMIIAKTCSWKNVSFFKEYVSLGIVKHAFEDAEPINFPLKLRIAYYVVSILRKVI